MRHGHGLRKLNRTSEHRLAMLRNMMNSLLQHEVIKTTVPKAKELRRVVEPMITLAKEPTVANKRLAFDRLRDRDLEAIRPPSAEAVTVEVFAKWLHDELADTVAAGGGHHLAVRVWESPTAFGGFAAPVT